MNIATTEIQKFWEQAKAALVKTGWTPTIENACYVEGHKPVRISRCMASGKVTFSGGGKSPIRPPKKSEPMVDSEGLYDRDGNFLGEQGWLVD